MRKEEGTPVVKLWILLVKGENCLFWHTTYVVCVGLHLEPNMRPQTNPMEHFFPIHVFRESGCCHSCIHGCYGMSCYYVLFGCICFTQFHSLTSDTVVTDDLAAWYDLGWSSKILPRYHFVGGFWCLPKVCFWIKISLDLRRLLFSGSRREAGDSLKWR